VTSRSLWRDVPRITLAYIYLWLLEYFFFCLSSRKCSRQGDGESEYCEVFSAVQFLHHDWHSAFSLCNLASLWICSLFNDAFSTAYSVEWKGDKCMMDLKGFIRKRSWPDSRHYTSHLEGLRKTTKNLSQDSRSPDRDLNPRPPEYDDHNVRCVVLQSVWFLIYVLVTQVMEHRMVGWLSIMNWN
jgi:hypothetical protein